MVFGEAELVYFSAVEFDLKDELLRAVVVEEQGEAVDWAALAAEKVLGLKLIQEAEQREADDLILDDVHAGALAPQELLVKELALDLAEGVKVFVLESVGELLGSLQSVLRTRDLNAVGNNFEGRALRFNWFRGQLLLRGGGSCNLLFYFGIVLIKIM